MSLVCGLVAFDCFCRIALSVVLADAFLGTGHAHSPEITRVQQLNDVVTDLVWIFTKRLLCSSLFVSTLSKSPSADPPADWLL